MSHSPDLMSRILDTLPARTMTSLSLSSYSYLRQHATLRRSIRGALSMLRVEVLVSVVPQRLLGWK